MENFVSLVQMNVLDRNTWAMLKKLRTAIVTWIEGSCRHHQRRQDSLGRLTPIEVEIIITAPAAQAA